MKSYFWEFSMLKIKKKWINEILKFLARLFGKIGVTDLLDEYIYVLLLMLGKYYFIVHKKPWFQLYISSQLKKM